MSSELSNNPPVEKDINMIVQLGDIVVPNPPQNDSALDNADSATRKAKRRAEREKEDEAVRKAVDPEGKLSKKELRKAIGEYYMAKLNPEQLQQKLKNPKYAQSAMKLLQDKGVDVSTLDVPTPSPPSTEPTEAHVHEVELPDSDYYFVNGHRLVWPYPSVHRARTKQRWQGRTLAEVMHEEFVAFHEGYLEHAVKHEKLRVNGVPVAADYVFQNNDLLEHYVHKHEPPVRADPVSVVHRAPHLNLLVINKPASLPVHPCGKFLLNSVTHVVAKETGVRTLHVVHRLDRATSGLLLLATDSQAAERISAQLRARTLRKHYLARVRGRFPATMGEARACAVKAHAKATASTDADTGNAGAGVGGVGGGVGGVDRRFVERGEIKERAERGESDPPTTATTTATTTSTTATTNATTTSGKVNAATNTNAVAADSANAGLIPPLLGQWGSEWGVNEAVVLWDGVGARTLTNAAKHMLLNDTDDVALPVPSNSGKTERSGDWSTELCEIVVDRPVAKTDLRYGLFGVGPAEKHTNAKYNLTAYGPEGKAALTCFRRISYDPLTDTSLVHCMPRTGRTHQLRVHLMHLGFPIANDERYGGLRLPDWETIKQECARVSGKTIVSEKSVQEIPNDMDEERRITLWKRAKDATCVYCTDVNAGLWSDRFHFLKPDSNSQTGSMEDSGECKKSEDVGNSGKMQNSDSESCTRLEGSVTSGAYGESGCGLVGVSFRERCCNSGNANSHSEWVDGVPMRNGKVAMDVFPENIDIDPEREVIWLHALKYEAPDWTFAVPAPVWAEDDQLTVPNMYYPPV